MILKFINQNKSEKDNLSLNIFKKYFLDANKFLDILIINANESITLWLFENILKSGSGLWILNINKENYLD